jgi:hypothetical protein
MRRLITLISGGRSRIVLIRRELPPNFKPKEAGAKLEKLGLKPDVAKDGLKLLDPDGILVQLNAPDYPGYLPGQQKP